MNSKEKEILFSALEKVRERHCLGKNILLLRHKNSDVYMFEIKDIKQARDAHCFMLKMDRILDKQIIAGDDKLLTRAQFAGRIIAGGLFILIKYHDFRIKKILGWEEVKKECGIDRKSYLDLAGCLHFYKEDAKEPENLFILKDRDFYEELNAGINKDRYNYNVFIKEYITWSRAQEESKKIEQGIGAGGKVAKSGINKL